MSYYLLESDPPTLARTDSGPSGVLHDYLIRLGFRAVDDNLWWTVKEDRRAPRGLLYLDDPQVFTDPRLTDLMRAFDAWLLDPGERGDLFDQVLAARQALRE